MFIKKLIEGEEVAELQTEFVKFSRGEFRDKYLISFKKQKDKWAIKTSAEFANYLVRSCLNNSKKDSFNISGVIVSTLDIKGSMGGYLFDPKEEVKKFMGIKQIKVNKEIKKDKIIEIMDKFPKAFFALTFSTESSELKIKPKAPKSAKPSTSKDKEATPDFCTIKTTEENIAKDLLFDCINEKEANIKHIIRIEEIIYPKDEKDPVKMRENSKRRGELIRILSINGQKKETIAKFGK